MFQRSIISNTLIASVARILGSVAAFLSFALIARALGPEQFGIYSTAFAFGYLFSGLADLGLYSLMTREISREGSDERAIVSQFISLRIVSLIASFGFVPIILFLAPLPYSLETKYIILLTLPVYFFLSTSQVLLGVFQKHMHLEWPAFAELASRMLQLLFFFILFFTYKGLTMFVVAAVLAGFLMFLINLFASRRYTPFTFAIDLRYWRAVLIRALPIAASLIFTLIYFKIDIIMLSILKDARDVGVYNLGYKFLESVIFFPAMFVGILFPLFSRFWPLERTLFTSLFQRAFDMLVIAATPIVFGGWFVAPWIVSIIGGSAFFEATSVFRWLLIAIWFIFLGSLVGNVVIAINKQIPASLVYFAGMVFNIVANIIAIPRFSYNGAAATTAITEVMITSLLLIIIIREVKYIPRSTRLVKSLFSSLVMAGALLVLADFVSPPVLILLGAAIYLSVLYSIRGITRDDLTFFTSPTRSGATSAV